MDDIALNVLFAGSLGLPLVLLAAGVALCLTTTRRVGGLVFFRLGRFGGSFYMAREG
jgi:hypothetical protein